MPEFLVAPWQHQKKAIEQAKGLDYFALFFEPGTGKTATLINILRDKFLDDKPFRTLILCPPIVIENWKREFTVYSRIPDRLVITLSGSGYSRLHRTDPGRQVDGIYITNYHSVLIDKVFERLQSMRFTCIVLDESHKIKTYNSKTTRRVMKLAENTKYRYVLSGSPILNQAFDIFPQIQFLDGGERLGKNFFVFRNNFYVDFNANMPRHMYFPNWKIKSDSLRHINAIIEPISATVKKKDCLDLPPLVRQRVDCDLTAEQEKVYKELEKEMVAEIGSDFVTTDLELTKALRLQQVISGFVPKDEGAIHDFAVNTRIGALRELLETLVGSHKVLIWAVFRRNFEVIEALLSERKVPFVTVHGGTPRLQSATNIRRFEEDNNIRVFLGHPRAAGIGINLTSASYSIFYSRGFSLEDDLQAEARNYRGGSERHESITRIDLVAPRTIDEVILKALTDKQQVGEAILNHYQENKHGL